MRDTVPRLLRKYRSSGILVDTNLLLLLCVGDYDPQFLPKFKRTVQFAPEDYSTLTKLLAVFSRTVTSPAILAEVNSLIGQAGEPIRTRLIELFGTRIGLLNERFIASADLAARADFVRFGLTDTGIVAAGEELLVLTDDFRLSQYLASVAIDVINFNHVRVIGWT